MDLRQLQYFVAVVRERSVSRAAETLTMTQPPLSAAIARLEKELGVRLLERHARGVDPTAAGEYLARRAGLLLAQVEDLRDRTHEIGTGRIGTLTVVSSPAIDWEVLPGVLGVFDVSSPLVETELTTAGESGVFDRVRERHADVGLVYCTRTTHLDRFFGRDLEAAMIRREPLVAVVPRGSHGGAHDYLELAALEDEPWVMPAGEPGFPDLARQVRDAWEQAGIEPTVRRTVADLDTLVRLVGAGAGVAILPASVGSVLTDRVEARRLAQPIPPIEAAVVWRRGERPSPVLGSFLRGALATHEPDRLEPLHLRQWVLGVDTDQ